MKLFLVALLSLAIRGTTGQFCGEFHHVEVYNAVIAAFGEENCKSTCPDPTGLECTGPSTDDPFSDPLFTFQMTCSFQLPGYPGYSATAEYYWGQTSPAAGYTTPTYLAIYSTISFEKLETDFTNLCLADFEPLLSDIISNRECPDSHEDVLRAVHTAIGGEENCETVSSTDGISTLQSHTCTYEINYNENPNEQKISATIQYRSDYNELQNTFTPLFLSVNITGSLSELGEVYQETYFTEYCLSEMQGILSYIAKEMGFRCQETSQEVIDKLYAAYGEENCQTIIIDGRPPGRIYECSLENPGLYQLSSSAQYVAVGSGESRYPQYLTMTQNIVADYFNEVETDFVDGPCLSSTPWESIFNITAEFKFRPCGDSSSEIVNDLITAYGDENCNNWYDCSDAVTCGGGWDCSLSVTGYHSTTRYEYQESPTYVEMPIFLSLNTTYEDDVNIYGTFSRTYDFTFGGSCRNDYKSILVDEVLSNRMLRNCSNSAEEITYTRKKDGIQRTTTCAELAQGGTKRMANHCKLYPEIAESCRGICRTGEYCDCAENPEAFPVKRKSATSTCLELADLAETKPRKYFNKCNRDKFERNCPRTCGCLYQEMIVL